MLIGLDCTDLHFSLQDIRGEPGQPIARLTPLGWTCVGLVDEQPDDITNFARTYFVTEETDVSNINTVLQKFWEIDSSAVEGSSLSCENKRILEYTENTILISWLMVDIECLFLGKVTKWFYLIIIRWHCDVYRILKKLW